MLSPSVLAKSGFSNLPNIDVISLSLSFPYVPAPRLISAAPVLNQLISIPALYLILLSSSTKQEAIFAPLLPPINSPELTRRATLFAPLNSLTEGTHAILRSLMEIIIWNQQVVKDKFVFKNIICGLVLYNSLKESPEIKLFKAQHTRMSF